MASQQETRIVKTPDVLGGKPRIRGRRIGVYFVREQVEGRGLSPREVAARYELNVADVHRALAYFHEHLEEMTLIQRERERLVEDAREDPNVVTGPEDLTVSSSE